MIHGTLQVRYSAHRRHIQHNVGTAIATGVVSRPRQHQYWSTDIADTKLCHAARAASELTISDRTYEWNIDSVGRDLGGWTKLGICERSTSWR